mmetsp:Transcript_31613/g.32197  ORF Transcript_31613/g.32197 Transcript_31613/m.32197 type:complete len:275 (-) Transcript_31613:78-902(-)
MTTETENAHNKREKEKERGVPEIERENVHKVYDDIAEHWHHTRGVRKVYWQKVKHFLENLTPLSLVADVGSGDGKYFTINPNLIIIGCDRSLPLLLVSKGEVDSFCCDAVSLPLTSNSFDAVICIAVLHHLSTEERRERAIRECVRIMKPGGRCMIKAWAKEQGEESRRVFLSQDVLVPWHLQTHWEREREREGENNGERDKEREEDKDCGREKKNENEEKKERDEEGRRVFQRYCHVYTEGEIEGICDRIVECEVIERGWDRGNWFVCLKKRE